MHGRATVHYVGSLRQCCRLHGTAGPSVQRTRSHSLLRDERGLMTRHDRRALSTASSSATTSANAAQMDLGRHFYLNKVLEQYAAKPATRMTLRQLVFFGRTLGRDRDKILKSANYVRQELAVRIAHRIRDLQALPFVVMTNAHLEQVYEKYWNAFETFRKIPMIRTLEDNEHFCQTLKRLLDDHLTIIPSLTIGIVESSPHLPSEQLDGFMERMLRSRISRRVLAEQHIALSEALDDPFHFFNEESSSAHEAATHNSDGDHIGIIYTSLKVSNIIQKVVRLLTKIFEDEVKAGIRTGDAAVIPEVIIDGALETRFAYIPEHLEYIFFELIKNSMMAVMRQPLSARDPVAIRATIVEGPPDEDLIVRVSDCGGGLPDLVSKLHSSAARRETHRRKQLRLAAKRRRDSHDDEDVSHRINAARDQHSAEAQVTMDSTLSNDPSASFAAALHNVEHARDIALSGPMKHTTTDPNHPISAAAAASAAASTRGAAAIDPLVATVTSFSNVRRRLEIEDEAMRRARQTSSGHSVGSPDDRLSSSSVGAESPGREKEAMSQALRSIDLDAVEARETGLDSRAKMDVLRSVGRFKGTVAEQLASHDAQRRSGADADIPWAQMGQAASAAVSGDLRGSFSRQETGLGLPMTKIYTDFFGGCLSLRSLDGHGMDVYVRLPKLGTNKEAIEEIVL